MKLGIRVVAPFRPFPPESALHKDLADFDWLQALRMMVHSAQLACRCPVHAITDVDTDLPVPSLQYVSTRRRLMLWTLEACALYLESPDFDRDTVMLDVDQLVYRDLAPFFKKGVDLSVLVRPDDKHLVADGGQPLLNGVQFWRHKAKPRLAAFYRRALEVAEGLSEDRLAWGADTDAVRDLLAPLEVGIVTRQGLTVDMFDASTILETFNSGHAQVLEKGIGPWPRRPVFDFRWTRKLAMPGVYRATIGRGAVL